MLFFLQGVRTDPTHLVCLVVQAGNDDDGTWDRITTKSEPVLPIGRPKHNTEFQRNRLITFAIILLIDRQDNRTNE